MPRKPTPPPQVLASVSKLANRRPGRPYKTLTSAIEADGSERDVLVLLRRRLAAALESDNTSNTAAFIAILRQFRSIDAQIRGIDAAAAAMVDVEAGAGDGDGGPAGWDPSAV